MDLNSNNTKSKKRKVLVDKLVEGYEFATQLQLLLSHQTRFVSGSDPDPSLELLAKILGTFDKTISVLDSFDPVSSTVSIPNTVEGSRNASCGDDSSVAPASCNGGDSGESRKRLGVSKGKRGCYTRKKRAHTWTVEARKIDEDGHAWRKYGQKEILNSKFPRSYFRCTHKHTQGCQAKKQIQKQEQDNHEMFQITYTGYHTCNTNDQTHSTTEPFGQEINMDSDNTLATTIAKDHVDHAKVQEQENNISSVTMVGKSMVKEEETNNNGENKEYCEASSLSQLVWQDMMMFDDHHHYQYHQSRYYCGDNDQFSSFFDPYIA